MCVSLCGRLGKLNCIESQELKKLKTHNKTILYIHVTEAKRCITRCNECAELGL